MAKKTKRSGGRKGGVGGVVGRVENDNVVSDGEISNSTAASSAAANADADVDVDDEDDEYLRRKPPALRPVAERRTVGDDNMQEGEDGDHDIDDYEDEDDDDDDDDYEDVYESSGDEGCDDDDAMATAADADADAGGSADAPPPSRVKAWNPFLDDETTDASKLEMDETAYKMHHALTPEWPSLTLDVVPDRNLGDCRTRFPHTVTLVVGSQADFKAGNKLSVLRLSDLCRVPGSLGREKTERELDDEMLGEEWKHDDEDGKDGDGDESSDDDDEEEEVDRDPILEHYSFPHPTGGINRVRVCPHNPDVVAAWGDSGTVSLYDIGGALDLLDRSGGGGSDNKDSGKKKKEIMGPPVRRMRKEPFFVYSGHSAEGYAIDWSRVVPGRLATADRDGNVHVWDATHPVVRDAAASSERGGKRGGNNPPWGNSSFGIKPTYSAHGDNIDNPSVEDLQWSPTEPTVLASGECGGIVRIYDVRCPGKAMISNRVHANGSDVNVISWNSLVGNLLASGGDDGEWRVGCEESSFSMFFHRFFSFSLFARALKTKPCDFTLSPRPLASGKMTSLSLPHPHTHAHTRRKGTFSVWDLRNFKTPDPSVPPNPLARFRSHRTPITSLEWHPTDESMIAVSDDRGTYIYDLSIEEDDPESAAAEKKRDCDEGGGIPPQLLFVHSGSEMTKEVRWHPQIPSCVATTSLSGFSVFIPSNL